jgi:hypothetical protein
VKSESDLAAAGGLDIAAGDVSVGDGVHTVGTNDEIAPDGCAVFEGEGRGVLVDGLDSSGVTELGVEVSRALRYRCLLE